MGSVGPARHEQIDRGACPLTIFDVHAPPRDVPGFVKTRRQGGEEGAILDTHPCSRPDRIGQNSQHVHHVLYVMGGFAGSRVERCCGLHDNGAGQERDAEFNVKLVLVVGQSNVLAHLEGPASARNRHGLARRTDCEQFLTGVIGGQ